VYRPPVYKEKIKMNEQLKLEYDRAKETYTSWLNWKGDVGMMTLMGIGDYFIEIRILEDMLNIPVSERFNPICFEK
jgi:hypothetical protein